MQVRLIVECDPTELSALLRAMPPRVQWHATRATYTPPEAKPNSVRAEVIKALPKAVPAAPKARKRSPSEINYVKERMVRHVAVHPGRRWIDLVELAQKQGSSRSHGATLIRHLHLEGRIVRDETTKTWHIPTNSKEPSQ